jgi:hypothetical protein
LVSSTRDRHVHAEPAHYDWLKLLVAQAPAVLVSPARGASPEKKLAGKVAALEEKLAKKDAVIAEISEEFVRLKKELGES